ncbi:oligosaccharide flippase family protein [Flexivirga alba]|uniref:Oligosaccharide flippase family protein n=1 Tax=Flexivirga alba TaxID=702742 RepID=A0ABW2AG15_9MICO
MSDSLSGRVTRAALWSGVNTIAMRLSGVVITMVMLRIVTPGEFGNYAVALAVFTVVSSFSELGLSACMARADIDPAEIGSTVSFLSIVIGVGLAVVMLLLAPQLAVLLGAPDSVNALRILALCIAMVGLFTIPCGLLAREFRQDAMFFGVAAAYVPSSVLMLLLALNGPGDIAFAWSRVLGQLVTGCVLLWFVRKFYRPRFDPKQARRVLRFGAPIAAANLVGFLLLNADFLFVSKLLGPVRLGIYTLAFNVSSWATATLSSMVMNVAMPMFSHAKSDPERLGRALRSSLSLICLVAFPISGFTLVLSSEIVDTLYGHRWIDAAPVIVVLGVYGSLFVCSLLLSNLLVGVGLPSRNLLVQIIWLVVLVPAMFLGVELDGMRGAAFAHVAVIVLIVLPAYFILARRFVGNLARILVAATMPALGLTIVSASAAWAAKQASDVTVLRLVIGLIVGGVVYLGFGLPLMGRYLPGRVMRLLGRVRLADWARYPLYDHLRRPAAAPVRD